MGDYHAAYKEQEGKTTEWDDLQVKHGNRPAPDKPAQAPTWTGSSGEDKGREESWAADRSAEELDEMDDDFDDDRGLEAIRQRRLEELRKATKANDRFGSVRDIGRADFVREVTNAGPDVWVALHLQQPAVEACHLLGSALDSLAPRFPATKFLRILSTDCIPGYPDANLPTVVLYHAGVCVATLIGLLPYGGRSITPEQVAFVFNRHGPYCKSAGQPQEEVGQEDIKALIQRLAENKAAEMEAKGSATV